MTTTLSDYPFVVILEADTEGVDEDSAVQLDQIRTLDIDERSQTKLGRVSGAKMAEIDMALKVSLGLNYNRSSTGNCRVRRWPEAE